MATAIIRGIVVTGSVEEIKALIDKETTTTTTAGTTS